MASINDLPLELRSQIPEAALAGIVDIQPAPGGGFYALGADGGVFSLGGAQYRGGLGGTQHLQNAGSRAARLEIDPTTGGYTIIGDKGHRYAFGTDYLSPEQAAERDRKNAEKNSIYQDPAYLAFVRGADLTLEEAARQVARRQRSLNDTLALRLPELQAQNQQALSNIGGSYEARGLHRSGKRLEAQAQQEQANAANVERMRGETAGQIAAEQEDLAARVAGVQREAAEKGFNVAQTQDLDKKIEGLRAKYPGQFAGSA